MRQYLYLEEVFTGPRCALMRSTASETASAVAVLEERAAAWKESRAKLQVGPACNQLGIAFLPDLEDSEADLGGGVRRLWPLRSE